MDVGVGNGYDWAGNMVQDKAEEKNCYIFKIIVLYQHSEKTPTSYMRLGTVYDQQIRNHRERGDTCFPVMIFRKEVIWKVKKWKQNDKRIILIIYADKY